jgi:hypothetical protein
MVWAMPTAIVIHDGLQVFLPHSEDHFANHRCDSPAAKGTLGTRIKSRHVDLMMERRKNRKDG